MAVPDTLLNAIREQAPTGKNPLGRLDDAPFSGDDGAGFATVMREVAPPRPQQIAETKMAEEPDAGNELPDLPARRARFVGINRQPASDETLEEFAVEMGIDRSLARLLLSGTANDAVTEPDAALAETPVADTDAKGKIATEASTVDPVAPPPWFILAVAAQPVALPPAETGSSDGGVVIDTDHATSPLADEDLLLWRASVGRAEMAGGAAPQSKLPTAEAISSALPRPTQAAADRFAVSSRLSASTIDGPTVNVVESKVLQPTVAGGQTLASASPPLQNAAALNVSTAMGGVSAALGLAEVPAVPAQVSPMMASPPLPLVPTHQLNPDLALQGARMLASMADGAATVNRVDDGSLTATDRFGALLAAEPSATKTKTGLEIRSLHELVLRRTSNLGEGIGMSAPIELSPAGDISERVVATSSAVAMSTVAAVPTPTNTTLTGSVESPSTTVIAAVAVSAEGAGQGQSLAGQGSMTGGDNVSQVLSTPDSKLSFGERVQAFADAVAQRVLGQIRSENWSVSLQLDPANLGAMDIDLTMRGNSVAATVGVANPEVRALLEAGLPRLKESLEASGLQLGGWSFGQSGSRGFGEALQTPFARASYRTRGEESDSNTDLTTVAALRRNDSANSAVDLFV